MAAAMFSALDARPPAITISVLRTKTGGEYWRALLSISLCAQSGMPAGTQVTLTVGSGDDLGRIMIRTGRGLVSRRVSVNGCVQSKIFPPWLSRAPRRASKCEIIKIANGAVIFEVPKSMVIA